MTRRNAFTSLLAGLAALLPWNWAKSSPAQFDLVIDLDKMNKDTRKRPRFELIIEPVGPVTLKTWTPLIWQYDVDVLVNGRTAHIITHHNNSISCFYLFSGESIGKAVLLSEHDGDPFPEITKWIRANTDICTEPPREAPSP